MNAVNKTSKDKKLQIMAKVTFAESISNAQVMSTGMQNNATEASQRGWQQANNVQLM